MSRPEPKIRVQNVTYRRGRGLPWYLRWTVNGREHTETFETQEVALAYKARLFLAARDGERWNLASGLPTSWNKLSSLDVAALSRTYIKGRAKSLKDSSRASVGETLSRFLVATTSKRATQLPVSYRALAKWIDGDEGSPELQAWIERWVPIMSDLDEDRLKTVANRMIDGVDGKQLGDWAIKRRFSGANKFLKFAASQGAVHEGAAIVRPERPAGPMVNRARVLYPSISSFQRVLEALPSRNLGGRRWRCMTAVAGLAGLRPSEVVVLEFEDLTLPETGWGVIRVTKNKVGVKGWSKDSEEVGTPKTVQSNGDVPIPPVLVGELKSWIDSNSIEKGPLFKSVKGTWPTQGNWRRALIKACTIADVRILTPYDLRRMNGSHMHAAGISPVEGASRLRHSLETHLKHYVFGVEGVSEESNAKLDRFYDQ
jgi:integrase